MSLIQPINEYAQNASSLSTKNVFALNPPTTRILVTEPLRTWRNAVEKRLLELNRLEVGWDGYRGQPVSLVNAFFAIRMLESICDTSAPTPHIIPGAGGDLQIEWHTDKIHIELYVKSPNNVHAWRSDATTGPDGKEYDLTNDFTDVAKWVKTLAEPTNAVVAAAG